jgi:anion-transporting  ArsA/GET3 family ATPase
MQRLGSTRQKTRASRCLDSVLTLPSAAVSLDKLLKQHRVVVCVGSGGVGKTTTAAALAVHAAMSGRRVLCLTVDPAHRLASSLGLDEMTTEEQVVSPELFRKNGYELKGHLSAMMLDTKRTFDELVARHASSPEARDRILQNRLYQYMSTSLAGTSDYMAMEKLHAVRKTRDFELIVLDTPPTANALDFLSAPERMIGLVDSPAMRWFIQAFQSTGSFSMNLVGKGAALVFKALAKFTGAEFLASLAELLTGLNDLFGGFKSRADEVAKTLRSREVAFVLVTSPRPLAIDEALYFKERLSDAEIRVETFVVNGVHRLLSEPSLPSRKLEPELAAALPQKTDPKRLLEKLMRALDDERTSGVADRIQADRLKNKLGRSASYVEVPAFDEDVHDIAALVKVASHLVASEGDPA